MRSVKLRKRDMLDEQILRMLKEDARLSAAAMAARLNRDEAEIAARIKAARWWQMSLNGSLFGYKFTSRYEGCEDASNLSYAIGMINNFTLGATTRMQFDANVVGPTVLTQGREEAYCYFDLAIRQQIYKNRISAAVVIHDLFHTALYRNRRATSTLLSTTRVRPKYPNIVLSLSYSFNAAHKEQSGRVSSGAMFDGKDF